MQDVYAVEFPGQFYYFTYFLERLMSLSLPLPPMECFGVSGLHSKLMFYCLTRVGMFQSAGSEAPRAALWRRRGL